MNHKVVFQKKDTGLVESFNVGKNSKTGEFFDVRDMRFNLFKPINEYLKTDKLLAQYEHYQGRHPSEYPWGAYVLPLGVRRSQKVYIEEIIEDISAGGFWGICARFGNAIGRWNGKQIILDECVSEKTFWDTGMVG